MASDRTEIQALLRSLKQWQKAIRQLKKKGKSPEQRQRQLEKAQQTVMSALESDVVMEKIDGLITTALPPSATVEELRSTLIRDDRPLMLVELRSVHPLPLRRKDLETIIDSFLRKSADPTPIASPQELQDRVSKLHGLILQEVDAIAPLSRKVKKQRRRDLTQSTLHTIAGLGLLAGNTLVPEETAKYSYILGGNALLMAMRFLVGTQEA